MIFLLRSLSRSKSTSSVVYDEEIRAEEDLGAPCTSLTVWRKSLVLSCSGFTVIDSNGCLAFRVDNYIGQPGELVLMDANGNSILTVYRRKGLRLVDDWYIHEGESSNSLSFNKQLPPKRTQPLYHVKKPINIFQLNSNKLRNTNKIKVLAHVYPVGSTVADHHGDHRKSGKISPTFLVEGSYGQRSCKVVEYFDGDINKLIRKRRVVAEIRRKEAINGCASFGLEVFDLIVWPGFDPALAMGLVLLLDQMFTSKG